MCSSGVRRLRARACASAVLTSSFVLLPLACATARLTSEIPTGPGRSEVADAEYEVYSFLLQSMPDRSTLLVADSTTQRGAKPNRFCRAPGVPSADCLKPFEGVTYEAWFDFAEKNLSASLLHDRFDRELKVKLVRNAPQVERTCTTPKVIRFSRVGFNDDRSQAVLRMSTHTGKPSEWGCGFVQGSLIILEKTSTGWRQLPIGYHWMS